jgi:molybdopterin converting factor subunit 1
MRILFFAHLKDATGTPQAEIKLGASVNAEALWQKLIAAYPGLARHRSSVRLARNCEYAGPDERFDDADEVALIPPVSGG